MLVIRIEEWPGGDADRRRPIARLEIANRSGLAPVSDYEVTLRPTTGEPDPPAMVYGHVRADGWLPLLRAALRAVDPDGGFYSSPVTQVPASVLGLLPLAPYTSRACQTARAILAARPWLDTVLEANGLEREAWAQEFFASCRGTEKWTGLDCRDPQHGDRCSTCGVLVEPYGMVRHFRAVHATAEQLAEDGPGNDGELTRDELEDLVEDLGQDAYRAQDLLAYIGEMCDAADRDGSLVTTERVRTWLRYTGCGGMLVLPEAGAPADGADAAPGSDVLARIRQAWVDAEDGWDRLAAVGMDGDRWRQILYGGRRASSLDCALVAEAFGVSVDWVLYGDVLPAPATSEATPLPAPAAGGEQR